jgi:hypothetical protein
MSFIFGINTQKIVSIEDRGTSKLTGLIRDSIIRFGELNSRDFRNGKGWVIQIIIDNFECWTTIERLYVVSVLLWRALK